MVGLGINLWPKRAPSESPFVSPNGLEYHLNDLTQYYSDTGATTLQTSEGGSVAAWKNAAGVSFTQATGSKQPTLNLALTKFGGKAALLFVDNQTTPTVIKSLSKTSELTTAMNTSMYSFAQVARNDGLTAFGFVWSPITGTIGIQMRDGNNQRVVQGTANPTTTLQTLDDDQGVHSASWDGTFYTCGWNNHEIGYMPDSATPTLVTNGATLRVGCNSENANDVTRWIGKWCRPQAGALTAAQRRAERVALGNDMGLPNSGKGKYLIGVSSNSIGTGFGATTGWPTLLQNSLGTTNYRVVNNSTNSIQTPTLASNAFDTGSNGQRLKGNFLASKLYKVSSSIGRDNWDSVENTGGGAPGWTTDQWAGWTVVFESGGQKGYGAVVASNDSNTLTLADGGFPGIPALNDTFRLYKPGERLKTCFGVFHEMTNDLVVNGASDGPAAHSNVKVDTPVYQRHVCACRAIKAYGYQLIGIVLLPRNSSAYANVQADIATIQGWMQDDTEGLWDAFIGFDEIPEMSDYSDTTYYQADGVHPKDAGHAVLAAAVQAKIEAML